MLEIFAATPERMGPKAIGDHARRVEAMGFDGLFVPDAVHDGLLVAGQALAATTRLRVDISVLVAFPRSPMTVALAAWDLQDMSGGRFGLGLGTQIRQNIEDRYSARWLPPAAGMRDYIGAMRAIFRSFRTGERLDYRGPYYSFTRLQPFFNPGPIDAPDVPLMVGAVGPKMLAMAGAVADGMHCHPTNTSPRYLREVIMPRIAEGTATRDPMLGRPLIAAQPLVATGRDEAATMQAREDYRPMLAFLFSTPAYWPSLSLFGWDDLGPRLQQMTRDRQWREMTALISDEMLDTFLVSAPYDAAAELIAASFRGLVDRVTFPVPADPAEDGAVARVLDSLRARWNAGAAGQQAHCG